MKRRLLVLLPVFAMAACTHAVSGHPVAAPSPQLAVSTTASPDTTTATTAVVTTPPDALFDPCHAVSWGDFPPAVRPADEHPAERTNPKEGARFTIACNFDNSASQGSVSRPGDPEPPTAHAELVPFLATVVWGPELDPADIQSSETQSITVAGKPAALRRATFRPAATEHVRGGQMCIVIIRLSRGSAGVTLSNSRFPGVDPCEVVIAVATALARRVP
ncbi:DUF3558 family protein [Gandjariella thermophila]|uniref:DUF3558 domain-containing protein n=1 Tax=Gandjariella thermophila TaxID=1931992 RepID=A0A4D4JAQ4_9PSEU|nr:DUF3558 family protein [Gandjariella thermophila]GDY33741.1 hypothetical protein GTS_53740 [Gandjariella thermophila]